MASARTFGFLAFVSSALIVAGCDGTVMTRVSDAGLVASPDASDPPTDAGVMEADAAPAVDAGVEPEQADAGPAPEPPPACPRIRVTTVGLPLNVRSTPRLDGTLVGTLAEGAIVDAVATVTGDTVDGVSTWYEIDAAPVHGFVSGRYSECTTDEPPARLDGFRLPLRCGTSARISQGNNSGFSHTGYSAYAFDFSLARGTTLHAMADGVVVYVYDSTGPGDPCYDGGGPECITEANQVKLRHSDGTVTGYAHLDSVLVALGAAVTSGTAVGRSGTSGYSTGPHAHVSRQDDCGRTGCPSIAMSFLDVPGDGVPETGDVVTSGNCP
jgi:murein DD-endopeptidase MepM/ murein hydrolase activator NlpD